MEEKTKTKNTKQPRSKRKLYFRLSLLLIIAIIVAVVIYIFSRLNQPETASVTSTQGVASANYYSIDLTPTPEVGPVASFNYPRGLKLVSSSLISEASVEDFNFYVKDISSWTLAIDISKTSSGLITQTSSYALRKADPSVYAESIMTVNGQTVDVMTDKTVTGGFSKVAYLTHGIYVATVSLVGADSSGNQPLDTTFSMVLDSWTWH